MNRPVEIEVKVGIFVMIGVALLMLSIFLIGGGRFFFKRTMTFHAKFNQVEGLVEGALVKVAGIKAGQIKSIELIKGSSEVDVYFTVASQFNSAIHEDSMTKIQTQGVLGDRYLVVLVGSPSSPLAKDGQELPSERPKELREYLINADTIMEHLKESLNRLDSILASFQEGGRADRFFKNMASSSNSINTASQNLSSILNKVDSGQGTLGALVNDSTLYEDMKSLIGGANRNRVIKYFIKKSVEDSHETSNQK